MGEEPKPRRGSHAAWCRVALGVRVREVADPKCRCAGVGRPRWILETPRSALPGPLHALPHQEAKNPARSTYPRTSTLRISHFPDPHTQRYSAPSRMRTPARLRLLAHRADAPEPSRWSAPPDERP